jgi:hypothetical protein
MPMNKPLTYRLMTARIHKAMNARIQKATDEGDAAESRRLDGMLAPMGGGWADESNAGAVLDLLLDDCERTNSSTFVAVVGSASATIPDLKVIEVIAAGLARPSSPAVSPAWAGQGQQEASQPKVEGVLGRL